MLTSYSIRELNKAFQNRQLTPIELTEYILNQCHKAPSGILTTILEQRALDEALQSNKRWQKGQPIGLLDGIPCVWKDLFDIKGSVTTAASSAYQNQPLATEDAPLVDRLTQAGCINIGKANLSELAYSGLGINPAFGTPHNPFDAKQPRIPGGSSCGSAAAICAGLCSFSIGSDTSGSIRIPAAFQNLAGYKPSNHRFNQKGVFPLSSTLDEVGPIAKTVQECYDISNICLQKETVLLKETLLRDVEFIIPENMVFDNIDDVILQRFQSICSALTSDGAKISYQLVPEFNKVSSSIEKHGTFAAAESSYFHRAVLASEKEKLIHYRVLDRMYRSKTMSATDYVALIKIRNELIKTFKKKYANKVLLMPTVVIVPPLLQPLLDCDKHFHQTNLLVLRNTGLFNFLDAASVSLPMPLKEGELPMGLMLSVIQGQDEYLLTIAHSVERALSKIKL